MSEVLSSFRDLTDNSGHFLQVEKSKFQSILNKAQKKLCDFENEIVQGREAERAKLKLENDLICSKAALAEAGKDQRTLKNRILELETCIRDLIGFHRSCNRSFSFLARDGISIHINLPAALSRSDYFKNLISSGMQEDTDQQIQFTHVGSPVLGVLADFIVLGPSCNDLIDIPILVPADAYDLMDLCTQIFLAYACDFIASKIECITDMNVRFLTLAYKQKESCSETFQNAWKITFEKAMHHVAANIERMSIQPEFSGLGIDLLVDIIDRVADENTNQNCVTICTTDPNHHCARTTDSGFVLNATPTGDSLSVVLEIADTNDRAINMHFDSTTSTKSKHSLFKGVITIHAIDSKINPLYLKVESSFVRRSWTWRNIFQASSKQMSHYYCEGAFMLPVVLNGGMPKLHRQCYALINFVCRPDFVHVHSDNGSPLLATLMYFHNLQVANESLNNSSSQAACKALSLLVVYTALGFEILMKLQPASMYSLPCAIAEEIIRQDCLHTDQNSEGLVLDYVLNWGIQKAKQVREPSNPPLKPSGSASCAASDPELQESESSKDSEPTLRDCVLSCSCCDSEPTPRHHDIILSTNGLGVGSRSDDTDAEALLEIAIAETDRLFRRVRFPYVPLPRIAALSSEQSAFAKRLPSYRALLSEAVAVQLASAAAGGDGSIRVPSQAEGSDKSASSCCGAGIQSGGCAKERVAPRLGYGAVPALDPDFVVSLL